MAPKQKACPPKAPAACPPKAPAACPPKYGPKKGRCGPSKFPAALRGKKGKDANFCEPVKESLRKDGDKSATSTPSPRLPAGCPDPRSPRLDKGVGSDAANDEAVCAQQKKDRMRKLAIGGFLGLLFLWFLWWLLKDSIYRFFEWPIGGDGENGEYGGSGGFGGMGGSGGNGGKGGKGGSGGAGRKQRGKQCWFNAPCEYDYEDDRKK